MLRVVLTVAALAASVPAQAGIVYDVSGQTDKDGVFETGTVALAPGAYTLTYSFDLDVAAFTSDSFVRTSYYFICPGSPPYYCGGNDSRSSLTYARVDARTFTASFRLSPERTLPGGIGPAGTVTRYLADQFFGDRSEARDAREPTVENPPVPFGFRVVITAVPEPASWALMIGGFGLAGAALRRRMTPTLA